MHLLVTVLLLVTAVQSIPNGENSKNSLSNHMPLLSPPLPPDESRFRKFLNMFGIGTSTNQLERGDYSRAYQQYGYPCVITTTTTPAPVVLSPLLCPFPPMLPAQLSSQSQRNPYGGYVPSPGVEQIPPPLPNQSAFPPHSPNQFAFPSPAAPAGTPPLLPPLNGSNSKPPQQLPGFTPQGPGGPGHFQPPHIFVPGMKPDQILPPTQPFPGQNIPTPAPIQNLPQPIQPGQGGSGAPPLPAFPGPLYPSNIGFDPNSNKPTGPTLVANEGVNSEQPISVDPVGPESPVKIPPVQVDPSDPVKVNPTIADPSRPVQVNPMNYKPGSPLVIDPVQAEAANDQPLTIVDPYRPIINDKGFSKYQLPPKFPYGPMNVLINPGYPEHDKQPLAKPATTPAPVKTELPKPKPGKLPVSIDPQLANGIPYLDGYQIIGPIDGSLIPPNLGSNAILIGPILPHEINQMHPPPTSSLLHPNPYVPNSASPSPATPHESGNNVNTVAPLSPNGAESVPPPPSKEHMMAAAHLSSAPPSPPFLPKAPSSDPMGPICGNPFLRPYVPPGFHLSSINQFIGLPPVGNPKFVYPCPTVDLLKALDFKIMRSLIEDSGLLPLFEITTNYTLFVPSDVAFRRLPRWFRESLEVDKKLKKALVLNHLIKEDLPLKRLENEELILTARPGGNRVRVNIYQQDNTYRAITVDGSEVEKGDILTSKGRVHIVNKVLMPNLPRNAAQFLSEKLEFESFWNLVKQADLVATFQSPRPFTLFIPVNDAVQKLNDSTFMNDKDKLQNFIKYHMVNGTYYSNGIINNEFLLTNYEKEVKLQVVSDNFAKSLSSINGNVRILKSDITLTNGVAHVIERCISEETPFYVYPQSDEFRAEYGVMKRSFRVTSEEKNISNSF